ncbi:MAG: 1,4-dihydroxy-2-naphthoate octaprenyltransferase [Verrucomicrobiales bacterium]
MTPWFLATRPKTLLAALVPVWVGTDLARHAQDGEWSPWLAFCTLASAVCIQIATNFFNDAIDFRKGADREDRVGPRRATASGLLSPRQVMVAAALVALLAALFALPLIAARGWVILAIGIPSLLLSYGYTGGPWPLAYKGLGELFVILFFGFVAVGGSFFVQTGAWEPAALVAGFQVGLLATVLIAVNNVRDIATDEACGKRTLAVRFGAGFARFEIVALCLLPYLAGFHWVAYGSAALLVFPLGALSLGVVISVAVTRTEPGPAYNRILGLSALQMLLFAILFSIGLAQ